MLPVVGRSPYSRGLLERGGGVIRLHLSAHKCDSCLPSLSLYFNIYFAPTDATMFQNIQQFHSGGSNTNSFRLLATLFVTKNSMDMRILSTELSQLKRMAIINAISICVYKSCPYRCYILKLPSLPIVLSDSKIDKRRVPFSVLSLQEPIDKKGTLFHLLQTNVIAR